MPTLDLVRTVEQPRMVRPLPESFSLLDANPLNGQPYRDCLFVELPPYAVAAIGVTAELWNRLVGLGAVALVLDVLRLYSLAGMLGELRDRQRLVWDGHLDLHEAVGGFICPDCLGTLIAHDFDGSATGVPNAPFLCACCADCWAYGNGPADELDVATPLRAEDVCGDCDGTLTARDHDGSITGTIGAAVACDCAVDSHGNPRRPAGDQARYAGAHVGWPGAPAADNRRATDEWVAA